MKHFFYKGKANILDSKDELTDEETITSVKKEFSKVLESRNLSFLIGSGCSLGPTGIPTMKELANVFFGPDKELSENLKKLIVTAEYNTLLKDLKIKTEDEPFKTNLEIFLGTLYSLRYYYEQTKDEKGLEKTDKMITHTKTFILYQCLNIENKGKDGTIQETYKSFYRKLSLRDSNLPKPNIFTTNYDLYSEKAMDELGITYTNGFSGFIERYFNPSIFNYALAEQMDISSFKWNVIDSFIYLFKIHGSVNWVEVDESNKLFKIKELQDFNFESLKKQANIMIYPSPIKQNASLGTPYSDLFRELQRRITQKQSVLVTMGYSFGDEHINNLIYQALTIPTFRLVIFSELGIHEGKDYTVQKKNIDKLRELNDPRIWIIGSNQEYKKKGSTEVIGKGTPLHFFSTISNDLLPDWSENQIESKNEKIIELLKGASATTTKNTTDDQG